MTTFKNEEKVDDMVKRTLEKLGVAYTTKSDMSDYMKESLQGGSKTEKHSAFGQPDFNIEGFVKEFNIPVVIEDKLHESKLKQTTKAGIKTDEKSVRYYAVNGAVHYARTMVNSGKWSDGVIAIGVAADSEDDVAMEVYYVFGSQAEPKLMTNYKTLNFLESADAFREFINAAQLTEAEKHAILIKTSDELHKQAKALNVLMNNMSIPANIRVIYVSGCLLAMQTIVKKNVEDDTETIIPGKTPDDLTADTVSGGHDGDKIVMQIRDFLSARDIPSDKVNLMMGYFSNIQADGDRDKPIPLQKQVSKLFNSDQSTNAQIFGFLYEYVFKAIDGTSGHLDIMGSMYSEFLKYALGDGKNIGIVLTPPYVTQMMTKIIDVNKDSHVMDLATGSAGFLISSMETMIEDANKTFGKGTKEAHMAIEHIKHHQLLGVELDSQMYTLAATNMILRGDGSSQIKKGNSFTMSDKIYNNFAPNRLLLNPPFSYTENGMPFIEYGMKFMQPGGKAAIIVQDSSGSGKAIKTNKKILQHNTLIASIKMPMDLFQPSAGVQTSIYVFETGAPHDFDKTVRFIDFRNDGYKRTGRGLNEIDHPGERYQDILKIVKAGRNAKLDNPELWDLDAQVFDDQISDAGNDWNFEQHQIIDTTPHEEDFMKTVGDFLSWEVSQVIDGVKKDD